MPIDHAETSWSEFLRQISAARGPNVKVLGQPIEDLLRANIVAADLSHLAPPVDWIVAAVRRAQGVDIGNFNRFELICIRATWIEFISVSDDVHVQVLDVPVLAGHALPPIPSRFSGTPVNLEAGGAAAAAAGATEYLYDPPTPEITPLFIPRGKVFSLVALGVSAPLEFRVRWREIPETR